MNSVIGVIKEAAARGKRRLFWRKFGGTDAEMGWRQIDGEEQEESAAGFPCTTFTPPPSVTSSA